MTYGSKGRWKSIGQLGLSEIKAQVRVVFDCEVNFINTTNVTSEGDSESLLGETLNQTGATQ